MRRMEGRGGGEAEVAEFRLRRSKRLRRRALDGLWFSWLTYDLAHPPAHLGAELRRARRHRKILRGGRIHPTIPLRV